MRWTKASSLIVLFVWCASNTADAQTGAFIGPMKVERLRIIQKAGASDKWAAVAYQEYVNGLIEGIFTHEGSVFCLPKQTKSGTVNDVFRRVSVDVAVVIREANADEYARSAVLNNFRTKFPC